MLAGSSREAAPSRQRREAGHARGNDKSVGQGRELAAGVLSVSCELVSTRWSSGFGLSVLACDQPPLCQCSRASFLVGLSINEVAFEIEVVVDIGMGRGELLKRLHLPQSDHRPLSWSER